MDYFKGTYSFFRFPNPRLIGFSPFLGYLNVRSGFLRKAFDVKRTRGSGGYPYVEQLVDEIFHSVQGNLTATIHPRKPIYIIAKAGLLNEFILHIITNNIEGFKINNREKIINIYTFLYEKSIRCKCSKRLNAEECEKLKSCKWDGECISDINEIEKTKNLRNFKKELKKFFNLVDNCINKESQDEYGVFVPYYLLGLTLMSYWYLISTHINFTTEKEYFNNYMQFIKNNIKSPIYNNDNNNNLYNEVEKIDEFITNNNIIKMPNSLTMINATYGEDDEFPACFETTVNEFFNVLFYDDKSKKFKIDLSGELSIKKSLIDHYEYINDNESDYTSHYIINKFVSLTTHIPDINYNQDGYNIMSNYNNFLTILNYFLGTNYNNLTKLFKNINVLIKDFDEEEGILILNINNKIIKFVINPGHSYFERKHELTNLKIIIKEDDLFNIFIKFLSFINTEELDYDLNFYNFYNMLNNNNENLPLYKYKILNIKNLNNIVNKKFKIYEVYFVLSYMNDKLSKMINVFFDNIVDIQILKFNNLNLLPRVIKFPRKLKELDISYTQIILYPEMLRSIENLKILKITNNILQKIPEGDFFPNSLEYIDLSSNEITTIPSGVYFPESLKTLILSENKINFISKNFLFPKKLEKLYLARNELETISGDIFPENLKELYLSSNYLISIPDGVFKIVKLEKLFISQNKLKNIPLDISYLVNLKELILYDNELMTLPDELTSLKKLVELNIASNLLTEIPRDLIDSKNIKKLYYYNNPF